ncbi:BatD family protein [Fulvitalea axinellae]
MRYLGICLLFLFSFAGPSWAQDIHLELGPSEIAQNQAFYITIVVKNGQMKSYGTFPEIDGFTKRGASSSTSTNIMNGQMSVSHSIQQSYLPEKQGTFTLKPFSINVNGKKISSQGKTIKVGPPIQRQRRRRSFFDPFGFDDPFREPEPQEYIEVKTDAFIAITPSKTEIYEGEGVNLALEFYVADSGPMPFRLYKINEQLSEIIKAIKPNNAWEENFNLQNPKGEPVQVGKKRFIRYRLFQATYFPLNDEDIEIPSVPLTMSKLKFARRRTFGIQSQKSDLKTFHTKAKTIKVKPLPPYPGDEAVAVGQYRLNEKIGKKKLQTGESTSFGFSISGKGNIAAITPPNIPETDSLNVFPPEISENIKRNNSSVYGYKSFNYYIVAEDPGTYDLSKKFQWVYFDPIREKYDTLSPRITLHVKGESLSPKKTLTDSETDLQDMAMNANNRLKDRNRTDYFLWFMNIALLLVIAFTIGFVMRK